MNGSVLAQALVTSVILGSLWGLLGTGFGLILGVTGRFNFAYSTTFIWGVYVTIELQGRGVPLVPAILVGTAAAIAIGVMIEVFLFRPLVRAAPTTALLAVFVSSLGIVIIGQNLIQLIWGPSTLTLSPGFTISRIAITAAVGFTNLDAVTVGVCISLLLGIAAFLRWTRLGRAIRAVRENPDMSLAVGINPEHVYILVFAIGSALSAIGGVLLTMRGAATSDAGILPTFTALVVMFLAGLSRGPIGFLIAGLFVGVVQNVVAIWLAADWTPAVTFGILFVFVALLPYTRDRRPQLKWVRRSSRAPAPEA
jgi:branched-chain amino acid transport system permease protein